MTEGELKALFRQLGSKDFQIRETSGSGAYLTTNCPLAAISGGHKHSYDHTPALSVSLRSGHGARCFACGFRGSLSWLVKQLNDSGLASEEICQTVREDVDNPSMTHREFIPRTDYAAMATEVKDFTDALVLDAMVLTEEQQQWLAKKGCSLKTAQAWGICGGPHGLVLFPVHGIHPITRNRIIAGVWARQPNPTAEHQAKYFALYQFPADQYVYGEVTWRKGLPMVIFEGMLDVLHAATCGLREDGYNLAAVQRSNLSSARHVFKIMCTQPTTIYIAGDNDLPGWAGAAKSKKRLDHIHPDVRSFVCPDDPKTMPRDVLLEFIECAPRRGLSVKQGLKTLHDFNQKLYEE